MKVRDTYYGWYMARQKLIEKLDMPGSLNPGMHRGLGEFNMKRHRDEITAAVRTHAQANLSDPFAAARAYKNFKLGLAQPGDYSADKHITEYDTINFLTGEPAKMIETNWHNCKVLCAN